MKLSSKTKSELVVLANEFGIDTKGMKKADLVAAIESFGDFDNVVTVPGTEAPADQQPTEQPRQPQRNTQVPLVSDGDMHSKFGRLAPGMNFVSKGVADWWLTWKGNHVRVAAPQEVQQYYEVMTAK